MQLAVTFLVGPTATGGAVTQGGSGPSTSSSNLALLALGISGASLAISMLSFILRAYRDDLRGPKVNLRMLTPPRTWDARVYASAAGYLVEVGEADAAPTGLVVVNLSGDCMASLVNPGARDGLIWDLGFEIGRPPPDWDVSAHTAAEPIKAVRGVTPKTVTVIFRSETMTAREALQSLDDARHDYEVKATYMADRGWFGRPGRGRGSIKIGRATVADGLRMWLRAHGA